MLLRMKRIVMLLVLLLPCAHARFRIPSKPDILNLIAFAKTNSSNHTTMLEPAATAAEPSRANRTAAFSAAATPNASGTHPLAKLARRMGIATRSMLVPVLSYGTLAAVGAALSFGSAVGLSGATVFGVPLPLAAFAAIVLPSIKSYVEYKLCGGGAGVATMMGGVRADDSLTALAEDVAVRAGLAPPAHVFEIPTDELNAFAAGFGATARQTAWWTDVAPLIPHNC